MIEQSKSTREVKTYSQFNQQKKKIQPPFLGPPCSSLP